MTDRRAAARLLDRLAGGELSVLAENGRAEASEPIGDVTGPQVGALWSTLRRAFPDLERRDDIFLVGENREDARRPGPRETPLVACCGSYLGTFREPFLGIPPTGGVVRLTYGEAHHIAGGRIARSWLVWDIAGLMMQAGCWPMAPPLGVPGHWPAPRGGHGIRLEDGPPFDSLDRILDMHDALHNFDGERLESMDMSHWAEDFMYWAAGNIGACRGLASFRAHHQVPFLRAFPDRRGAGHFIRVSDGPFAVTGGDVALTHTGDDYMGIASTGRKLRFRVMDFYRIDGAGKIAENWLPNDTIGLMDQMGVDVMARMRHLVGDMKVTL